MELGLSSTGVPFLENPDGSSKRIPIQKGSEQVEVQEVSGTNSLPLAVLNGLDWINGGKYVLEVYFFIQGTACGAELYGVADTMSDAYLIGISTNAPETYTEFSSSGEVVFGKTVAGDSFSGKIEVFFTASEGGPTSGLPFAASATGAVSAKVYALRRQLG